jgi:hypothetical protein
VTPQNSLQTAQPWGPVPEPEPKFKPDVLEPGLRKIVDKIQRQKQQQTTREAMPLLRELAASGKSEAPQPDLRSELRTNAALEEGLGKITEQIGKQKQSDTSALLKQLAARSKLQQKTQDDGAVLNDAVQQSRDVIKRTQWAGALRKRSEKPEDAMDIPPFLPRREQDGADIPSFLPQRDAPVGPMGDMTQRAASLFGSPEQAGPKSQVAPEAPKSDPFSSDGGPSIFTLPESRHWHLEPSAAADIITKDAMANGKSIRNVEGYRAATHRRLQGEQDIYTKISSSLASVAERGAFHKYLSALWGADSPEVVRQVRDHMVAEFPQHAASINKHLSDTAIAGLWTKSKK